MLMASLSFSTANQDEMEDFTVIPVGQYNAQIVKSEIKDTKSGDGKRLNLQFKIIDGDCKGRIIFNGLNIANPNPVAVEISLKELTSICKACGKNEIEDSAELHGIPLTIHVKIKAAQGNYAEQNTISKYEPYGGGDSSTSETAVSGDGKGNDDMPWQEEQ